MSTNNIGFYKDLTNNIFELSSNIIKYAPYFLLYYSIFLRRFMSGFSSPEPKTSIPVEPASVRACVRVCTSVNTFKHEYLCNQ